ncbi:MAG: carboxypeptidase regulatory-like domain-containing protein [Acidobacteria bacterium]|nr:carboxypeptidase regulatory-like domain-containing protein [Acidobacteriota bacterium]
MCRAALYACLLSLCLPPHAAAQDERGRISGVVRDASGRPVPNVSVRVVNQVTSRTRRVKSGSDGSYFVQLEVGAYRITVDFPFVAGFAKDKSYGAYARVIPGGLENIVINSGQQRTLDIPVEKREGFAKQKSDGQPTGFAGGESADSAEQSEPDRREVRDRWRIGFPEYDRYGDKGARGRDIPFKRGRWYDPYNQSVLKGDYPIIGRNKFMILSGVSTTAFDFGRTPKPTDVSSVNPGSAEFFGHPEALALSETLQFTFEFFKGETVFKPRNWAIKISPTLSLPNYLNARENGVVNIDVRRGTRRTDTHFSFEEAFVEKKLFDVNANYDFVSVRVGIQPFVSDFRGFVYSDNNLGARLFGAFANNRYQFNLAYFRQLEKDTNSGLNRFESRKQNIFIANIYRQDFIRKGYTIQATALYNDDRGTRHFDRNGFLVRPAQVGDVRPHKIGVAYLGINGDGHIGRLNLTHSYYFAFGYDTLNPIAGKRVRVRSQMAAAEASIDKDYLRFRASFLWASGDKNPTDGRATGFDAILDDPNFIGGPFSFWNRQGIRLTQTGVGLVQSNSLLPTLRSSKLEGQANFVNPGIFIYNIGADAEVTQRLKLVANINYLRFHRTESLEYLLFQNRIRHEIGLDYNIGVAYRPFLINNVTFTFGASVLQTGRGFRDIYTDMSRNCPFPKFCEPTIIAPNKPLYALFAQVKFVF